MTATPRLARSKSGADLLFDKMKQEKFQHEEQEAIDFLNTTLDLSITRGQLHQELKDGVILCNLVNKLRPGTIKHVGQRDLSFVKMDNITRFLQGARQLGLNDSQLFETIDLFEAKDMSAVIHTILVIAQMHTKQMLSDAKDALEKKNGYATLDKEKPQPALKTKETSASNHGTPDPASCDDTTLGNTDVDQSKTNGSSYRDVRDIFITVDVDQKDSDNITGLGNRASSFVRPPRSPLRPTGKPNRRPVSHQQRYRRKSAEDLQSESDRHRRPSAPDFSSHAPVNTNSDFAAVALSRTSSTSSCSSFLSSASSGSSFPETPISPSSPSSTRHAEPDKSSRHRRQSVTLSENHQNRSSHSEKQRETESLGRKLDKQLLKSMEAMKQEDKCRERLLLKSKDGLTRTQYQLGNCIGKGQFGSVYRALDLSTGETVAVKRIKIEDAELDKEIMKEVGLLKTLSHKNVIQYMGFIRSKNHLNIVLEYAENGSLMSTLKAFGAFPEKLVASFCIKILNGLEYLHANDVVHCDLKAANILTTKTGDVKLSDFGVSLNLKIKGADAGSVSGTPNWMAPEVIELKGASTKSDIWSLGCTLVELITGKPPYADLIAMSAMFRIVEDSYPPLPDNISEEMHSFLLCCFQKNPDDRPTATQLKEHIWIRTHQRKMKKTENSTQVLSSYLGQKRDGQSTSRRNSTRPMSNVSSAASESNNNMETCHPLHPTSIPAQHSVEPNSSCRRVSFGESESGLSSGITEDEDYTTHRFIQTSFGKVVECKVCGELMKTQAIFCEVCSLICHEDCKKLAFSCPPKVNDQQPSYDWVFSAKIYNRDREGSQGSLPPRVHGLPDITISQHQPRKDIFGVPASALDNHPQAESIRKYSRALGLTPQEERALCENQALLSHTLALQHMNPNAVAKLMKKGTKDRKKILGNVGNGSSEDCTIS